MMETTTVRVGSVYVPYEIVEYLYEDGITQYEVRCDVLKEVNQWFETADLAERWVLFKLLAV